MCDIMPLRLAAGGSDWVLRTSGGISRGCSLVLRVCLIRSVANSFTSALYRITYQVMALQDGTASSLSPKRAYSPRLVLNGLRPS